MSMEKTEDFQEKMMVVKRLLSYGMAKEMVSKITGMSVDKINEGLFNPSVS